MNLKIIEQKEWVYYERPNHKRSKKWPYRADGPSIARARFGPHARFGHYLFTKSQMVEEIWAEFHRVIIGLKGEYRAVVKLPVFEKNHKVL